MLHYANVISTAAVVLSVFLFCVWLCGLNIVRLFIHLLLLNIYIEGLFLGANVGEMFMIVKQIDALQSHVLNYASKQNICVQFFLNQNILIT